MEAVAKPIVQRKSYSIKEKMTTLVNIETVKSALLANGAAEEVTQLRVLLIVKHNTGIPLSALKKWILAPQKIRDAYEDKKRHQRGRRKLGRSGRPPRFPKSEGAVGKAVRERRSRALVVTKRWTLDLFKTEAAKEDPAAAEKCRFGPDMFRSMLGRLGLACRLPSCTKAMSLDNGVLAGRGWHRFLLNLVRDEWPDGAKYALRFDPVEGRFLLKCRMNQDEVLVHCPSDISSLSPGPAQSRDSASIISVRGERQTHVRSIQGWGDRIATMVLGVSASGKLLDVVLIFKGQGTRLPPIETAAYSRLKNVHVIWQKKAWIDRRW